MGSNLIDSNRISSKWLGFEARGFLMDSNILVRMDSKVGMQGGYEAR